MGYLVLPRKGPRPLGLAAQNLLALRVVSRPRRLYQLLVATHLSTAQGQLNYIGGTHHYVIAKQLFLQFMSPSLLTHCVRSVRQVFADTLPPSLARSLVPFQDRRPAFFPLLLRLLHARARAMLPSDCALAVSKAGLLHSTTTPTNTVFRGRRKPNNIRDLVLPGNRSRRCCL